jgi:hypothetical protein
MVKLETLAVLNLFQHHSSLFAVFFDILPILLYCGFKLNRTTS